MDKNRTDHRVWNPEARTPLQPQPHTRHPRHVLNVCVSRDSFERVKIRRSNKNNSNVTAESNEKQDHRGDLPEAFFLYYNSAYSWKMGNSETYISSQYIFLLSYMPRNKYFYTETQVKGTIHY